MKRNALLILAAGAGSRFGGIKQLAPIESKPMLRHVIEALMAPELYSIFVVTGAHESQVRQVIADLDIQIIDNPQWEQGLSTSIVAGVESLITLQEHIEYLIIVLGDQYLLNKGHIRILLNQAQAHAGKIIASDYDDAPGVPVCVPRAYWSELLTLEGDHGAQQWLKTVPDVVLLNLPEAKTDMDHRG